MQRPLLENYPAGEPAAAAPEYVAPPYEQPRGEVKTDDAANVRDAMPDQFRRLDDPNLPENREPPLNSGPGAEPVDPAKNLKSNVLFIKLIAAAILWLGVSPFFLKTTNQLTEEDIY